MNISYSWTSLALLGGFKIETRRDWSVKQIALARKQMENQTPVQAWSNSSRFTKMDPQQIANIRIVGLREENPAEIPDSAWSAEGFHVLQAIGQKFEKNKTAADVWRWWRDGETEPHTVVEFKLLYITEAGWAMLRKSPLYALDLRPYTLADLRRDTAGKEGWGKV